MGEFLEADGRPRPETCRGPAPGSPASKNVPAGAEPLGLIEVARLLDWNRPRTADFAWSNRDYFPEPVAVLATGPIWLRSDIEAFGFEAPAIPRSELGPASG